MLQMDTEILTNPLPDGSQLGGVPKAAILPLSKIATRSVIFSASAISWVARMIVVPLALIHASLRAAQPENQRPGRQ